MIRNKTLIKGFALAALAPPLCGVQQRGRQSCAGRRTAGGAGKYQHTCHR